jgi:tryptophan-rich sensory protein
LLWMLQLLVNVTWVPLLFGIKNLVFSLAHILFLFILIIIIFYFASTKVKMLWAPYMVWVGIASIIMLDTVLTNIK